MNILFLSSVYPHPSAPTRGTYNWQMCQALRTHAGLRIVAPRSWLEWFRASSNKVDVAGQVPTEWPTFFYPPRVLRSHYGKLMWWSARDTVRRATKNFVPDWVLSYWAFPDGDCSLRAARSQGAKSAVIIGGSDVLMLPKSAAERAAVMKVLHESDLLITVCDGLRERCLELGVKPERVVTVYQGVDRAVFKQGGKAQARLHLKMLLDVPVFLWVGRLADVKRVDVLIRAFARFIESERQGVLYLVGSGPLKASLVQLVQQLGLSEHVIFAGPITQPALPTWYQAADATLLSSESEGLPNVLRESLACGTPFVSTNVGSIAEIADPSHSILVPVGNEAALARALNDILDPIYANGALAYRPVTWEQSARDVVRALYRVRTTKGSVHGSGLRNFEIGGEEARIRKSSHVPPNFEIS